MNPIFDGDLLTEGLATILVPADILAVWASPRRVGPNVRGSAVVFLDFDGTLISDADSAAGGKLASGTGPGSRTVNWRFQTEATAALRQLAEAAPAASFVISSSWRVHGLPTISKLFAANGCEDLLTRLHRDWATPVLPSRVIGWDRIREIDAWLADHDASAAAALDDDLSIRFRPWGIWVDPSRGLTQFEARAALARLQAVESSAP